MNFSDFGLDVPYGRSGEVATTCPECSHTRKKKNAKCLSVNVDKGVWNCSHCGWTGGLPNMDVQKIDKQYHKPEPIRYTKLPENVVDWFKRRKIKEYTLAEAQITSGKVWMPQIEKEVQAIKFPYYRGDELVNVKSRDSQKNFRLEKGAERVLFGLNTVDEATIIVEGEMDALSMYQVGFKACVSVPDGAPAVNTKDYSSKFNYLDADDLSVVQQWIIAVDSDEAGQKLEEELSRRLGRENCLRVRWPAGCKDANEVLVKHGGSVLQKAVDEASPYPISGIFTTLDMSDNILNLYKNGAEKGVSTGWNNLDLLFTVRPGEMTIVTGMPSSGKSNWLDAMLVNIARAEGWSCALFSPENQPIEEHMSRMIEKWSGEPFNDGVTPKMDMGTLESGNRWAADHFFWILPEDDNEWTVDVILEKARALVRRHGIRMLVIDPWNELEHLRPNGLSETEYTSVVLKRVRQFARRNGVHVFFVAHPTKMHKDKDGNYPPPTPYDISGSAHWRNKADNCLSIYRDFNDIDSVEIQVHVQKIRFRQIGKLGMATLKYNKVIATYSEVLTHGFC